MIEKYTINPVMTITQKAKYGVFELHDCGDYPKHLAK